MSGSNEDVEKLEQKLDELKEGIDEDIKELKQNFDDFLDEDIENKEEFKEEFDKLKDDMMACINKSHSYESFNYCMSWIK